MEENWSEQVEDLIAAGDADAAISVLESVVSNLQTQTPSSSDPQLASALTQLAKLYSSKGFSLKADHLFSRAYLIQQRLLHSSSSSCVAEGTLTKNLETEKHGSSFTINRESLTDGDLERSAKSLDDGLHQNENWDDDWEAIADRSPDELLSIQCVPGVSKLSLETTTKAQAPKRRGRGTFSYEKHELYSDHLSDKTTIDNTDDEDVCHSSEASMEIKHSTYGTRHILVLADFLPSMKTIELEKLFDDFKDGEVVIRWVNDTTALAVFQTPSIALEASKHIKCSFTVRVLDEDDDLLSSISPKDLEPPRQRPKTSARTAQRLIAQGMGLKLASTSFGSRELRQQEADRNSRIVTRQKLKDDAWGADD